MSAADVVVVGGGVVGLSVAWAAATAGLAVTVCDPAPGRGATRAAAGMLAPVTEARPTEAALGRLGLSSLRRWPGFAAAVADDAGLSGPEGLGFRQEGTVQVAFDDDDRRQLAELAEVHHLLGLTSEPLSGRECRRLVPTLHPRIRGGLLVAGDWQADPRRVAAALIEALGRRGGRLRTVAVRRLRRERPGGPVSGVELEDDTVVAAGVVVLAAGAAVAGIDGLPGEVRLPVRPVKGEILRLRAPAGEAPLALTVRGVVRGEPVYLVPRADGEVVIGATMQEGGYDTTVRAGAVLELLRAAVDLVPAVGELVLAEASAGLRPATPDNGPLLGPTGVAGLHAAAGHFRNGVLLAPITADALLAAVTTGRLPAEAAAFHAGRYT